LPVRARWAKLWRVMGASGSQQHSYSVSHVHHLVEVVKRWDVRGEDLLDGAALEKDVLTDPHARVSIPVLTALLERARSLTGEPALGLYIGLQTRPTLFGKVGFAVMSASTIREAIETSIRYGSVVTTAISVRLRSNARVAELIVDEHADFGSARDIFILTTLVGLYEVSRFLTGRALSTSVLELAMPDPGYGKRLEGCGLRFRFDRPVSRIVFDARSLDLPYTMPDPVAAKLAREQCQAELEARGLSAELTARVRGLIWSPEGGFRGLEEVAAAMNRSPRTLKRQLGAQSVSFSALREDELRKRASVLLRLPDLSLDQVATRLGYSNVTSFERAFQRWTGTSPASQRREIARGSIAV
jgi:AraC-like DNA-binding protein